MFHNFGCKLYTVLCVLCVLPTIQANHKEQECGLQINLSIIANCRVAYPFHSILLNKNAPAVASIYNGKSFDWLFVRIQQMEFNFNLLPFWNKCVSRFFSIPHCILCSRSSNCAMSWKTGETDTQIVIYQFRIFYSHCTQLFDALFNTLTRVLINACIRFVSYSLRFFVYSFDFTRFFSFLSLLFQQTS